MSCLHRYLIVSLGGNSLQLSDNLGFVETELMDNRNSEKEMVEFEKKESEFLSPSDLVGKSGIVLKVLDEIILQRTDFGMKPAGKVSYKDGLATIEKTMRFNQTMINHLIDATKSKDSKKWIGTEIPIEIEQIMGNHAIVPKKVVA